MQQDYVFETTCERVSRDDEFPELMAWVQWSYHTKGELRFGNHRIVASAGVQQGDPLGPLLFFAGYYGTCG